LRNKVQQKEEAKREEAARFLESDMRDARIAFFGFWDETQVRIKLRRSLEEVEEETRAGLGGEEGEETHAALLHEALKTQKKLKESLEGSENRQVLEAAADADALSNKFISEHTLKRKKRLQKIEHVKQHVAEDKQRCSKKLHELHERRIHGNNPLVNEWQFLHLQEDFIELRDLEARVRAKELEVQKDFIELREHEEVVLALEAESKRLRTRLAEEAEKKRLEEMAEQKRLAEEAEKKRLAYEEEKAEQRRLVEEVEKEAKKMRDHLDMELGKVQQETHAALNAAVRRIDNRHPEGEHAAEDEHAAEHKCSAADTENRLKRIELLKKHATEEKERTENLLQKMLAELASVSDEDSVVNSLSRSFWPTNTRQIGATATCRKIGESALHTGGSRERIVSP
jgi:hypothetical protein